MSMNPELPAEVTLEKLLVPEGERVRLAEIKLECESLWQKVKESEVLFKAKGKQFDYESARYLHGVVIENIAFLTQPHSPDEVEDRIRKIELAFAAFKEEYNKVESLLRSNLISLNEVLEDGNKNNSSFHEEESSPAVEKLNVSEIETDCQRTLHYFNQLLNQIDLNDPEYRLIKSATSTFSASYEALNSLLQQEADDNLEAIGAEYQKFLVAKESLDQEIKALFKVEEEEASFTADVAPTDLPAVVQNDVSLNSNVGGIDNGQSAGTGSVHALSDLANLSGINEVIKSSGSDMTQQEKGGSSPAVTNPDISSYTAAEDWDNDEQWDEIVHNVPDTLSELEDYAGPTLPAKMYSKSKFAHSAPVSEIVSSRVLHEPLLPSYRPGELAADVAFYRAWQNGNIDQVFRSRRPVSRWKLKKIAQDIDLSLRAAGYNEDEIKNFFTTVVEPWLAEAAKSKKELLKNPKATIDHTDLKTSIIKAVSAMLVGHEPNEDVFIKNYETRDEAAEESEGVVSPEAAVGENAAETMPSIEEEKDLFAKAKEELVNRGLHIKFHYALVDVERHLAAVERITVDGEMPIAKKVERISQHKAALQRLLNEIIIEAFAADGTSTPATEEGLPPPTPDALTLPITAKDEAVAALREKNPVTPIERGNALSELDSNPDLADLWRQSRREFGTLKIERQEARAAYYENEARSAMGKLRSVAKIFGLKPQLPKELQAIEERYEAARKNHAAILSQMDRVKEKFDLSTAAGKRAFARHFVLNPHLREQQLQAQVLEKVDKDAKYTAAVKNVLAGLRKYKWHTRVGTIVAVAALGAATGGAAAGGFAALTAAGRMAASTGAGALAAFVTREGMQALVEKKEEERDAARQSAEEEFSLDALEELEAKFISTDTAVTLTKKRKDVATVAAALAGGFSAGAGVTELAAAEAAPTVLSEVVPHKSFDLLDMVPVKIYSLTDETNLVVSDIDFIAAKEGAFEVSEITRQLLEKQTELAINDILSAHKNMPASQVEAIVLERLQNKFGHEGWWQRADVKAISIGSISETTADVTSATSEVTSAGSAADNLDYGAINNDAGGVIANTATGGSGASTPDNLDYGALNEESGSLTSGAVAAGERAVSDNLDYGALNEATPALAPSVYEVKSGDTLWKIMENKYADSVLKDLSAAEKNRVLDALFDKARADTALRESIGLNPRAGGDIDKLWPGDKLNTTGLEAELKKIVAGTETLPVRPRTGALPIEAERGEHSVPITNRTNTPPVYPSIQKDAPVLPAYADPVYINPVRTGVAFGAEGVQFDVPMIPELPTLAASVPNYLETTEYKNIIEGLFGGENEFNRAVTTQVQALEAGTYDFMNRVLQDFKSPYSTKLRFEYDGPQTDLTLSKMTLAEIQQLRTEYKDPFAMREFATMNGFKYETLDAWFKKIDDLKASSNLPYSNKTTLADLLGRSVAKDTLERQFNALYEAKQLAKK